MDPESEGLPQILSAGFWFSLQTSASFYPSHVKSAARALKHENTLSQIHTNDGAGTPSTVSEAKPGHLEEQLGMDKWTFSTCFCCSFVGVLIILTCPNSNRLTHNTA